MFNVILKWNNHTWKNCKIIFCGEKWVPNQRFYSRKKSFKSFKKAVSEKEILSAYLCGYDLQNGVRKFFLNGSRDI